MDNSEKKCMHMGKDFILYKNIRYKELIDNIMYFINAADKNDNDDCPLENTEKLLNETVAGLIVMAEKYGLEGNLFHGLVAITIAENENPFSLSYEINGQREGSINLVAMEDIKIFKKLMEYDYAKIDRYFNTDICHTVIEYRTFEYAGSKYNKRIKKVIMELVKNLEMCYELAEYFETIIEFYRNYGVGKFGLNKAFRIKEENEECNLIPITGVQHIYFDDIVGYDFQKKQLKENTQAFVDGKKANNVLLFGDSGTGKSSSIKAVLNEYFDKGLRMIEVYKHQFNHLSDIIDIIKDRRYKFIIFMDDLSFEDFEIEYKYLKAIIEGGLEKRPDNVLIYATSNRRHLIREKNSDNDGSDGDLHANDTVQEKLSLSSRFGLTIYYGSPEMEEYKGIVKKLADRENIDIDEETLYKEAVRWEMRHGGLSGRTAEQFISHLLQS